MPISSLVKKSITAFTLVFVLFSLVSPIAFASDDINQKFESSVRIGYVPHAAFRVDNGVGSGVLADLFECSIGFYPNVEFVEISNYSQMMSVLESNVIDIALNLAPSKARDKVANYVMDLYTSRILLVNDEESSSNSGAGVLAVKQGSGITLLLAKGFQVNTKAYSIDRLIEMYRKNLINSFAENELVVINELQALDTDDIDYDYQVLAEFSGGAYVANEFAKRYANEISQWKEVMKNCLYLAPKVEL